MNKTKVRNIEIYQIRRNKAGDFLFVIPADTSVSPIDDFSLDGDDLIIRHEDGRKNRLLEIPDSFISKIRQAQSVRVVESRDQKPVADHLVTNREPLRTAP